MKKSKSIMLIVTPVLSSLLFNACGGRSSSYESTTRDVYQSIDDCKKDWGEAELCEEMNDTDSNDYRQNGGVYTGRPYYGPSYYPSDRTVVYKGRTVSPTTRSTTLRPYTVSSRSSTSSRSSSVSSPRSSSSSSSYGGFGGRTGGGSYSS